MRALPALLCLLIHCAATVAAEAPMDFQHQVAPILAEHCVRCHSAERREGDVALDSPDDLVDQQYVVAGDPDHSHLIELIKPQGGEPPAMPKEGRALSASQIETLRTWIAEGAVWPEGVVVHSGPKADASWWAFQPLSVNDPGTESEVTLDDFIDAGLTARGLRRSPPADRRTLIRRLSFDLHGLPPTPEAVKAFVNDPDPRAYEKLVESLLESPHYGERFARHWLDLSHYADTHGFERDQRRDHAWRYRDYVIESLNNDKPYDRFIQEQIAGDVLWPDDASATIATGFLAAGPWDFVGQVETKSPVLRRSSRSLDLDDMATQVMTATLAMTVHCARCHDHKLDPISQREYYQLRAVFSGVRREDRVVSDAALQAYQQQRSTLQSKLNTVDLEIGRLEGRGVSLADLVGGGNGLGSGQDRQGIDPRTAKVQTRDFGNLGNVITNRFSESSFEGIDGVFIPDGREGRAEIPISSSGLTIKGLPSTSGKAWDMIRNGPVASQHSPALGGIDFTSEGHSLLGLHANAGITFDLSKIRESLLGSPRPPVTETASGAMRLTAKLGYFGAEGEFFADAWVFVDGKQVAEYSNLKRADGLQQIRIELPDSARFLTLVATDGGNGYGHDQIGFGDAMIRAAEPSQPSRAAESELAHLREKRERIAEDLKRLGPPPRFYGVVAVEDPPEVRLLNRGDPESPIGPVLSPAAPSCLAMLDANLGSRQTDQAARRAELARWITAPENPLFRRVIVNRLWQWHFKTGIVSTPSDFGFGGDRPSHPELLDWLADQLLQNDWSLKAMHRLIVNSETYKQTSHRGATASRADVARRIDADNRLLWRQNPRRIEAEAVRDSVLLVSGKLNPKRGGPGFEDFEYQDAYAPIYTYITADSPELWRRSIYRYTVRTTPNRFMTTLDRPDPANLTAKRLTTTTPLQSLALLNNAFMLKQAGYFARRVENEAGDATDNQVDRAFELALGRLPTSEESLHARRLVNEHGLFTLCRSLFNANEFVYVD